MNLLDYIKSVEAAWATEAEKALRPPLNAEKKKSKRKRKKKNPSEPSEE